MYDSKRDAPLAHLAARSVGLTPAHPDYDDAVQEAHLKMHLIASKFDTGRGNWFQFAKRSVIRHLSAWRTVQARSGFSSVGDSLQSVRRTGVRGRAVPAPISLSQRRRTTVGDDEGWRSLSAVVAGDDRDPADEVALAEAVAAFRAWLRSQPARRLEVLAAVASCDTMADAGRMVDPPVCRERVRQLLRDCRGGSLEAVGRDLFGESSEAR